MAKKDPEHYAIPKLYSKNSLTEEVTGLPTVVASALMTGRSEMLKLHKPWLEPDEGRLRAEYQACVNLIRVLLDTNDALQKHCQYLADQTQKVHGLVTGTVRALHRLENYANFIDPEAVLYEDEKEIEGDV